MKTIRKEVSEQILTIGTHHKNLRGGIGAVIHTYTQFFETFHFVSTYNYNTNSFNRSAYFVKQVFVFIKTLLINRKIKIVHIHGSQKGSFYRKFIIFLIAKKIFRKKIVYHLHSDCFDTYFESSPKFQKRLISYFINGSDRVICLATFWKNFFVTNFKNKNISIVNNVITKPKIKPLISEKPTCFIQLLFLGRIGDRKGIFDIIRVFRENKDNFKGKIKLVVGGDGDAPRLRKLITQYGLEELIDFRGWIEGEQKKQLLSSSHIYILPSYSEGLPISILEAMSYGLPIISTPVGGIPEILGDNINGKLIEAGNLKEIESAILFFVNNPSKIEEYGNASYKKIEPFFPSHVADQLQILYENLLNKN